MGIIKEKVQKHLILKSVFAQTNITAPFRAALYEIPNCSVHAVYAWFICMWAVTLHCTLLMLDKVFRLSNIEQEIPYFSGYLAIAVTVENHGALEDQIVPVSLKFYSEKVTMKFNLACFHSSNLFSLFNSFF